MLILGSAEILFVNVLVSNDTFGKIVQIGEIANHLPAAMTFADLKHVQEEQLLRPPGGLLVQNQVLS